MLPEPVHVDVVLYTVLDRDAPGRAERLVLRRGVFTALTAVTEVADTEVAHTEVAVEQLWCTATLRTAPQALAVVRGLAPAAEPLVLGRPMTGLPGWHPLDLVAVDELDTMTGRPSGLVERLVGCRGTVRGLPEPRQLMQADIVVHPGGILTMPAYEVISRAVRALLPTAAAPQGPDRLPPPAGTTPPSVADLLRRDLRDARRSFVERDRWELVSSGSMAPLDRHDLLLRGVARPDAEPAVFTRWHRLAADGAAVSPDPRPAADRDSVVVTLVGAQGAKAGDHDVQEDVFCYRLDPRIDLHALWQDTNVQLALADFAGSRGDPTMRRAAVDALCAAGGEDRTDPHPPELPAPRLGSVDGTFHLPAGTVVLTDCHGIQVGDDPRRYNTFSYTVTPEVGTAELFREHPEVLEAIIDHACGQVGPSRRHVEQELNSAVCGSARGPLPREPSSAASGWTTFRRTKDIAIALGIGEEHTVTGRIEVPAVIPRALQSALDDGERQARAQLRKAEDDRRAAEGLDLPNDQERPAARREPVHEGPGWTTSVPGSTALTEVRNAAVALRSAAPGVPIPPDTTDRIVEAVRHAVESGESYAHLQDAVRSSATGDTTTLTAVFDHVAEDPAHGARTLRDQLKRCEVGGSAFITHELESLEDRMTRFGATPLDTTTDARGHVHLDWTGGSPSDPADVGHLVLVDVEGVQAGADTRVNVTTHVIDDPPVDFDEHVARSEVADALGALSGRPSSPELRQAALDALSGHTTTSTGGWTDAFAAVGTATTGRCAERLAGTVAVVRSRTVRIGNHRYQENQILHTVSPTVDGAALLAGNAQLANGLLDMTCNPGSRSAAGRFDAATSSTPTSGSARSSARDTHGRVHRPPGTGRTLVVVEDAAAVAVGTRVSQKTDHLG